MLKLNNKLILALIFISNFVTQELKAIDEELDGIDLSQTDLSNEEKAIIYFNAAATLLGDAEKAFYEKAEALSLRLGYLNPELTTHFYGLAQASCNTKNAFRNEAERLIAFGNYNRERIEALFIENNVDEELDGIDLSQTDLSNEEKAIIYFNAAATLLGDAEKAFYEKAEALSLRLGYLNPELTTHFYGLAQASCNTKNAFRNEAERLIAFGNYNRERIEALFIANNVEEETRVELAEALAYLSTTDLAQ